MEKTIYRYLETPTHTICLAMKRVSEAAISETYKVGWSACSVQDRFVKARGRRIAEGRMNCAPRDSVPNVTFTFKNGRVIDAMDALIEAGAFNTKSLYPVVEHWYGEDANE